MNTTETPEAAYLRIYGFARPVRKRGPRTAAQAATRALIVAEMEERAAKVAAEKAGRPTAAQYVMAAS